MSNIEDPLGRETPVAQTRKSHVLDKPHNMRQIGVRIERSADLPWTAEERNKIRAGISAILGAQRVGINAHAPECVIDLTPDMIEKIKAGVHIEDVGNMYIDESIEWNASWQTIATDAAQDPATPTLEVATASS